MKLKELKLKAPKSAVVLNNREKKAIRGQWGLPEDDICRYGTICMPATCMTREGNWGYCGGAMFIDSGNCTCLENYGYAGYQYG